MPRRRSSLALITLLCSACAMRDQAGTLTDAVRDSAGVTIVTHSRVTVANVPDIDPVEELRIGSVDGAPETQFVRIGTIEEGGDGSIWMYDIGTYRVSVFDVSGRFLRSFGGRGSGPGEFGESIGMALVRDTLLVAEVNRVSTFDRNGNLLATQLVDRGQGLFRPIVLGHTATPRGMLVMRRRRSDRQGQGKGPFRDTVNVHQFDATTAQVGPVVRSFAGPEFFLFGTAGWVMRPLFNPESKVEIMRNGWMSFTEGADYAIDIHDETGALIRRIRADVERIHVTDDDMREYIRRELADRSGGSEGVEYRKTFEQVAEELGHAEFRPVIGRILGGLDGSMLVERLDFDDEPFETGDDTTFDVIDGEGKIVGRVRFGEKVSPRRFTGTHVYAAVRDDDDVQYLVRYRLR